MRKLVFQMLSIALIFTACGCCCSGSHRLWPFCGTRHCYDGGGGFPGTYLGPSSGGCATGNCPTGACPPSGGGYLPQSYNTYDQGNPGSAPVAYGVPTTAMSPIQSLPTY